MTEKRAATLIDLPVQSIEELFSTIFRNPGNPARIVNLRDHIIILNSKRENTRVVALRYAYGDMLGKPFAAGYAHLILKQHRGGVKILVGVLTISLSRRIEQEDYPVATS